MECVLSGLMALGEASRGRRERDGISLKCRGLCSFCGYCTKGLP